MSEGSGGVGGVLAFSEKQTEPRHVPGRLHIYSEEKGQGLGVELREPHRYFASASKVHDI